MQIAKNFLRTCLVASMLLAMVGGRSVSAAESISTIRISPLVIYEAADLNAARRSADVPKGPAPEGWVILETKNPFYRIDAGALGSGWVTRSSVTKGASVSDTGCGNTFAGTQAQITGGVAGMGNCKK